MTFSDNEIIYSFIWLYFDINDEIQDGRQFVYFMNRLWQNDIS